MRSILCAVAVGLMAVPGPALADHRGGHRDHCYEECDGGSDGNSGGDYEGGRGGSDYDGDGAGNRCRNFCIYGLPAPGQGGQP